MKLLITLVFLTVFATPLSAAESMTETIQRLENSWAAAYNANDVAGLLSFYEEDAVLVAPGAPPAMGHTAIGEVLQSLFPVLVDLTLVTDEVRRLGDDHAVEIGHSLYHIVSEDGTKSPGTDNYQVVWHRGEDGVWRYTTDMFNARQ